MITYTVYNEAGGVAKTTLAANLAHAHVRQGLDVLVIDLDPQDGSLTYLLGIDAPRADGEADNLVRHMLGRPKGDIHDLIQSTDLGIDVLPSHNMLESFTELLVNGEKMAEQMNEEFNRHTLLHSVLADSGLPGEYDVIICDPQATAGPVLYNAIYATRSLTVPLELSGKGAQSKEGLDDIVVNMESTLGIDVGVLAVVPNGLKDTKSQLEHVETIQNGEYPVPVTIRDRESMMGRMWDLNTTAYEVAHSRNRVRERELDTLAKIDTLADHIAAEFGVDARTPDDEVIRA